MLRIYIFVYGLQHYRYAVSFRNFTKEQVDVGFVIGSWIFLLERPGEIIVKLLLAACFSGDYISTFIPLLLLQVVPLK